MKKKISLISLLALAICFVSLAQNLQVETILNLNASGGVTFGPDGNIYVSDFGPALGTASVNTKVFQVEYGSWNVNEFATGFSGASGSRFDSQGNFYQSNPSGGRVSKRSTDGSVDLNWVTQGMNGGPIGITNDKEDNLYVCVCGSNTIRKVTPDGTSTLFASSFLFKCPNGITIDPDENLYVCNFNDGRIIKITKSGVISSFKVLPVNGGIGNGHLTYSNGFLFVATIGVGQIFKISLSGESELIAGKFRGFSNVDGPALEATFSKPNGIAASATGDTLFVNCSVPSWPTSSTALHPGLVRMITGVCSLEDVDCPLLTKTKDIPPSYKNEYAHLLPPTPNPAQESTTFFYQLHDFAQTVELRVVDSSQKIIRTISEGRKGPGSYSVFLDISDWPAGVYYLLLDTGEFILSRKFIVT